MRTIERPTPSLGERIGISTGIYKWRWIVGFILVAVGFGAPCTYWAFHGP